MTKKEIDEQEEERQEAQKQDQQLDIWMRACHPSSWMTKEEIDEEQKAVITKDQKAAPKSDQQFDDDWTNWRPKGQPDKSNSTVNPPNMGKLLRTDNFWKIGKS